ncbi:MAG: hypothetical protein WC538_05845 [Thermoanaerobaculia bacterium]|jgi:hypothetical protein
MIETYEKRGASVRVERSGRSASTIVAHEHGRALRERGRFRVESLGDRPLAQAPDVAGATDVARRLGMLGRGAVAIERLTVAAGMAEHSVAYGKGTRTWNEEVIRVHLSLVDRERGLRVALDLGAERAEGLPIRIALELAEALQAPAATSAPEPGLVELAPAVSAALWTFVARHPALYHGSRLKISQWSHPSWAFDGAGRKIEHHAVDDATPPSLFRPSFRVAPVPAWFHLHASLRGVGRFRRSAGTRTVGLLSPFRLTRSSVVAGVLAVRRTGACAAMLEIPRQRFAESFLRIGRNGIWFPLEAGAWGSDVLLDGATITPRHP